MGLHNYYILYYKNKDSLKKKSFTEYNYIVCANNIIIIMLRLQSINSIKRAEFVKSLLIVSRV